MKKSLGVSSQCVSGEVPRYKRITLPCGATATVTEEIKPETIAALDEMCRCAIALFTSTPFADCAGLTLTTVGLTVFATPDPSVAKLLLNGATLRPSIYRYFFGPPAPEDAAMLREMIEVFARPEIRVPLGGMHALADAERAVAESWANPGDGKRIFRM